MQKINLGRQFLKTGFGLCIALTVACTTLSLVSELAVPLYAASYHDQQSDLRKLQKRISNLQKQIRKDTRLRDESQARLEKIDQDIANTHKQLRNNQKNLELGTKRIEELESQQGKALSRMGKQQQQLAAMLKLAHQNKQVPALKILLSENDPAKLGRQMVYYRHLMKAQNLQVGVLTKQVRSYVELLEKASQEKSALEKLQSQNTVNLHTLEKSRAQREALVNQLAANIKDQSSEVQQLRAEEKALNQIITELERTLESFPDTSQQSFQSLRGKLAWPVQGKVLHRYGQTRVSGQQVRWRGVFVGAERNTEIRSVAYGRVVYADWLPGHGLITIIDHGNNYLSLYANAEMLFKEVGAWVQAGEILATVGDSGGNKTTGLYFEIRRGKQAKNPTPWFKKRTP